MKNQKQQEQLQSVQKRKWYKKIKNWIFILFGGFVLLLVLAFITTKGMPIIDIEKETNKKQLTIDGWGVEGGENVKVYLNDKQIFETIADEEGKFMGVVELMDGENTIYAIAEYNGKIIEGVKDVIIYTSLEKLKEIEEQIKQEEMQKKAGGGRK